MKRILALALLCTPLYALDLKVTQVNDRRTNGSFSHLMIVCDLPKVPATDVTASRVIVAAATDDSGHDLVDHEGGEPQLEPSRGGEKASPASVSMTLKNPDRKATKVAEVRGEVELYMPGKDPNSTAEIAKFLSYSGKPITHKALKANGVEISLVSPAQIDAERKKRGDAKRKEGAEAGLSGESLDSYVSSYLEYELKLDESDVLVRIKDPNKRIQDISYIDSAGQEQHVSRRDDEGYTYFSTWSGKPQADWKLRVNMTTAKNLVRQPFTLKDVALP